MRSRQSKATVAASKKSRKAPKVSKSAKSNQETVTLKVLPKQAETLHGDSENPLEVKGAAKNRNGRKTVKPKPALVVSKKMQETSEALHHRPLSLQADRVLHSLEAASADGADSRVVDSLAMALQACARAPEAVTVLGELAVLLRERHDPSVVDCLARDLERGADPDLIGTLAGYLKAGLAPNQIGALAWFFPRSQLFRPRQTSAMASH